MASERILLTTDLIAIGRFICPPDDARWTRENWIGPNHHVVFPARAVGIEQRGVDWLLADPNHAVLYDAGTTYRRRLVSPDGDIATYVILRDAVAQDLLGDGPGGRPARFRRREVWLDAAVLLRLRLLARALERGRADPLAAEATVLEVVGALVARADGRSREPSQDAGPGGRGHRAQRSSTRAAHRELVEDAKAVLAARFAERLSLAEVGRAVGASPYHLTRVFRAETGRSIHAYREQVRLRTALDRLTGGHDTSSLALLAAELGFASHSHLDARFRRTFGRSPGEIRSAA